MQTLDAPSLQNISVTLNSKQLLAVIGPVGAGKSTLLSSILGELPAERGVLRVNGQLTYAAQQPWVFPGTIRSNILFGKEMNQQQYERVIRACALKRVRRRTARTFVACSRGFVVVVVVECFAFDRASVTQTVDLCLEFELLTRHCRLMSLSRVL